MYFEFLPPEINSTRMYAGPGSASLLTAAQAWQMLAADLEQAASIYHSVVQTLQSVWQGASSVDMSTSIAPYIMWLQQAAEGASETGARLLSAAAAYQAALSGIVPPPVVAMNRVHLSLLTATNIFGQNAAAIAANEAAYAEMWAQDGEVMNQYLVSSDSATSTLPTFSQPTTTAIPLSAQASQAQSGNTSISSIISQLFGNTPIFGLGGDSLLGQYMQASMGGSIFFIPTELLSLLPLWGIESATEQMAAAVTANASALANPIATGGGVVASMGISNRINTPLAPAVPPAWTQPPAGMPQQNVTVTKPGGRFQTGIPVPPAIPVLTAGRSDQQRKQKPDPEYGQVSKVAPPRHPLGG